jgi:rhodanese-related sulfurtransferase
MLMVSQYSNSKTRLIPQIPLEEDPLQLLDDVRANAQQSGLSYAGNVSPHEAWALFSSGVAKLVDVRTERELRQVGHVPDAILVEWLKGTQMSRNQNFLSELENVAGKDEVVLFLCRSGKRSVDAAIAACSAGYSNVFNVLEGFEGSGGLQPGWRARGLPAAQD